MNLRQIRISRDWLYAGSFALIGLILRLWHLGTPKGWVFDEVYYAKNANSLLHHGVEIDASTHSAEFVVHPPIGKWVIALGIKAFGYNEFGWRFSAAIIGTLSILVMYFTAKKLFASQFIINLATLFILIDGLHLVHSRVALLDIFLTFFIQLAFLAILHERYWLAGISLGLAIATKWSGLYFLVAFAFIAIVADWLRYRYFGKERPIFEILRKDLWKRLLQFALIPVVIYLASWLGWFITKTGWDRTRSKNILSNFWFYHSQILNFHAHLTESHPYKANPWGWLLMARPTSFSYSSDKSCGASACAQEVLAIGTPLLWWSATLALLVAIGYWISRREWKNGVILTAIAAGYLPWFAFQKRTMFTFYAISFEPFLLLALAYICNKYLITAADEESLKRRKFTLLAFTSILIANFLYFLPLYFGTSISYNSWLDHMWLTSWI
jgi:dolichyl-phosphate-mannose--protein O-mannosyl transferase